MCLGTYATPSTRSQPLLLEHVADAIIPWCSKLFQASHGGVEAIIPTNLTSSGTESGRARICLFHAGKAHQNEIKEQFYGALD
jgi:hypothetical protein